MRRWTVSALVRVIAFRMLGAKSLPEPLLINCQVDLQEHTSVKFEWKYKTFHSWKCIWTCCLRKWPPFCPGGDELKSVFHYYSSLKNLSVCTVYLILNWMPLQHYHSSRQHQWRIYHIFVKCLGPSKYCTWNKIEFYYSCCMKFSPRALTAHGNHKYVSLFRTFELENWQYDLQVSILSLYISCSK